jgi:protein-S-isoprenylcysteine O-methyltransferase Ste14
MVAKEDVNNRQWDLTPGEAILMVIEGLAFIAQIVLCAFFYNSLASQALLYLGWGLLAVAMVLGWRARVAFQTEGKAHSKDWLRTTAVVDSGVYAVIRHPMYLSFMLMSLALVSLSQQWPSALLGALLTGLIYNDMRREEISNTAKFGDAYLNYMERVPRLNLVTGIIRLVRRKSMAADAT